MTWSTDIVFVIILSGVLLAAGLLVFSVRRQAYRAGRDAACESRHDEAYYRQLFEDHPLPMLVRGESTLAILEINQAAIECCGYSRAQFLAMTTLDLQSPATREDYLRSIAARLPQVVEMVRRQYVTADHRELDVEVISRPFSFHGQAARLVTFNDVTAQVRGEQARRESEARLRAIADNIGEGLALYDQDDRLMFFNEAYRAFVVDATPDLQPGMRFQNLVEDRARRLVQMGEIAEPAAFVQSRMARHRDPAGMIFELRRSDGRCNLVREAHTPQGETVISFVDITDLKQREAALRDSEARFRAMFDHAGIGISIRPLHSQKWEIVNDQFCEMTGYSREELLRMDTAEITAPEDREAAAHDNRRLRDGEITRYMREKRLIRKDGSLLWVNLSVAMLPEAEGGPRRQIVTYQDITAGKLAEERVRESEGLFRAMFNQAGIGITLRPAHDRHASWLAVNDKFCEMTGYSREELLRMSTADITVPEGLEAAIHDNRRLLAGEITGYAREKRIARKDGGSLWVLLTVTGLPDAQKRPWRLIAAYQDISARKQAEEQLRDREEHFRAMFDYAGIGITLRSAQDRHAPWLAVNDKFCEMSGYSREELLRMGPADVTLPEEQDAVVRDYEQLQSGVLNRYTREKRLLRKDGSLMWTALSMTTLPDAQGRPWQIITTSQDIDARKQAEARLRESEGLFRAMFSHADIGIALRSTQDRHAPWLMVNDKFCEMTGYSREELLHMSPADVTLPGDQAELAQAYEQLQAGKFSRNVSEKRLLRKDGSLLWIALSRAILLDERGKPWQTIATSQDIHALKLAEERMRESEARLRAIVDAEPECVAILAPDGTVLDMNPAGLKMLDATSLAELQRHPLLLQVAPQYRRAFVRLQRRVRAGKSGVLEFEALGLSGRRCWLELHAAPLRDAAGAVTALLGVARDVTERRAARVALAAERNLLRTVIENMPDMVHVKDRNLQFMLTNQAWLRVRARGRMGVAGLLARDIAPSERAALFEAEDRQVLESGLASEPRESVWADPAGGQHWYVTIKTPLRDDAGDVIGVVGISRDITDYKRRSLEFERLNTELEARVAERTAQLSSANEELEAFASSVSHDLRAPLRHIDGYATALSEEYGDRLDEASRGYLERIRISVARMGGLIEDLLRLSRVTRAELRIAEVDLSEIVHGIAEELRREQPQRAVIFRIAPDLRARADSGMLRAALVNLLHNAWKFTGGRPAATIEFGAMQGDGLTVYFVRDDGAGFDMARADRLFGTFQRLHDQREFPGTGIGLATVRRVMRRHGGDVWAESAVGQGATFYFTLGARPARGAQPAAVLPVQPVPMSPENHAAPDQPVVLLVDDDPDVLLLTERALKPDLYQVLTVGRGEDALTLLHQRRIDVVVSDFSMPGMNGAQLLAQVAVLQPQTLRVMVSGQEVNASMREGLRKGEIHRYFEKQPRIRAAAHLYP